MNIVLTNSDIRFYLVWLADIKTPSSLRTFVVRQVIKAFQNNGEHQLKTEILNLVDLSRRATELNMEQSQ